MTVCISITLEQIII